MTYLRYLILPAILCFSGISCASAQSTLYTIVENERWGYIDSSGEVIVKPQFRSAGQFSEGLAPVRMEGRYGYIDRSGTLTIPTIFDYALPFDGGNAKVYIDGVPYLIDRRGDVLFEHSFAEIDPFGGRTYSIVKTASERYGVVDLRGRVLADTIYSEIAPFQSGLAVVEGPDHRPWARDENEVVLHQVGVIDTTGRMVVQFGRYNEIDDFVNGFAEAQLPKDRQQNEHTRSVLLDSTGKELFIVPGRSWRMVYGGPRFSEGIGRVEINSVDPDTISLWSSRYLYTFVGAIDPDGRVLFSDTAWTHISPFNNGRAFVKDTNDVYHLIDRSGSKVGSTNYREVPAIGWSSDRSGFQDGTEIVRTSRGWRVIDLDGRELYAVPSGHGAIKPRGAIVTYRKGVNRQGSGYVDLLGFWDEMGGEAVAARFDQIDFAGFRDGLLLVLEERRTGYVDRHGEYVWREMPEKEPATGPLNIDYMNRGYFYASSPEVLELAGVGGWARSDNESTMTIVNRSTADSTPVLLREPTTELYRKRYRGDRLVVANTTTDTLFFDAQDSRLSMKVQARDREGVWRDIEYLPSSWCGNSYHTRFLSPGTEWSFLMPVYEGDFRTRLRVQVAFKNDADDPEERFAYSDEFEGGVNPAQFWRKPGYAAYGLMDPYND